MRNDVIVLFGLIMVFMIALDGGVSLLEASTIKAESFHSVEALKTYYESTDYSIDDIVNGQYVIVSAFPDDFDTIRRVDQRKKLFHRVVLPLIYLENSRIKRERQLVKSYLSHLKSSNADTGKSPVSRKQVLHILERYEIDSDAWTDGNLEDYSDTILRRVQTIPPSLVLAQAVTESGWGTSRFCLKGNNIFGQRTYDEDDPGLVPKGIGESADFKVRKFHTLLQSVQSYMLNLNTHWAYEEFRRMRHQEDTLDGLQLVKALSHYSERRGDYIESIRNLIKYNDYSRFDGVLQ
jgi:Bax protein